MHNKVNKFSIVVAFASAALVSSQTLAAGFQVREQSAKTLANAQSNAAAGAEDASFMAYNPAAIGNIDDSQVVGGVAYIDASFELNNAEASNFGFDYDRGGSRQGGETALVPSFAAKTQLNDRFDLGLAIYSPYGLSTNYDREWVGRYHGIETELKTVDVQPTLNYRASDRLSLAVGLRAEYADATLSNAVDLGAQAGQPGAHDGHGEVTGDDWGYGYTLGALFQITEQTRLGISYRSEIDLALEGEARFSATDATSQAVLNGAQAAGTLTNGGGRAQLTTPANMNLGVYHKLTDRLALTANAEWTEWSSFDELLVEFDDNTPDSITEENWGDTWAFSVGANYAVNEQWLLRAGLGYDPTPIPGSEYRTPRVPDADRKWTTIGATWMPTPELGITAGYMRVFGSDVEMSQETSRPENTSRGYLSGTYEVSADVLALSVDYRF